MSLHCQINKRMFNIKMALVCIKRPTVYLINTKKKSLWVKIVLFDSASGNTPEIATYIGKGAQTLKDTIVRLKNVDVTSKNDLMWCHGIAVGSPKNIESFLETKTFF